MKKKEAPGKQGRVAAFLPSRLANLWRRAGHTGTAAPGLCVVELPSTAVAHQRFGGAQGARLVARDQVVVAGGRTEVAAVGRVRQVRIHVVAVIPQGQGIRTAFRQRATTHMLGMFFEMSSATIAARRHPATITKDDFRKPPIRCTGHAHFSCAECNTNVPSEPPHLHMDTQEREQALLEMRRTADAFYRSAIKIGNHPFIEFAGLMNEYIAACQMAHNEGLDFSACNIHNGKTLPLKPFMSDYINEKLECIFSGAKVMSTPVDTAGT
jgi:hypothetical protein